MNNKVMVGTLDTGYIYTDVTDLMLQSIATWGRSDKNKLYNMLAHDLGFDKQSSNALDTLIKTVEAYCIESGLDFEMERTTHDGKATFRFHNSRNGRNCRYSVDAGEFQCGVEITSERIIHFVNRELDVYLVRSPIPYHRFYGNKAYEAYKKSIKDVLFNDPATIVFWNDGSKTVVKAADGEAYDPEKGLAMAISKKYFGNEGNYYNEFKKWLPEEETNSDFTIDSVLQKALDNLNESASKSYESIERINAKIRKDSEK